MNKRDKTVGIRQAAAAKRQAVALRAEAAIVQLQQAGMPINYNTLSKAAKVSKAWLYINLKPQVEALRTSTGGNRLKPYSRKRPEGGVKAAILATLKKRIHDLENDNKALRYQLEVAYGRLASKK